MQFCWARVRWSLISAIDEWVQAMLAADLRDQLDLHGIAQAQQYLQEKLNGSGSALVKRLMSTDPSFKEAGALCSIYVSV